MVSPLTALIAAGVSIWLDDLSRERLRTGSLAELVASRHVSGVATNPSIFAKAISTGDAYQSEIEISPPVGPRSAKHCGNCPRMTSVRRATCCAR